jgi:hypothetical protein
MNVAYTILKYVYVSIHSVCMYATLEYVHSTQDLKSAGLKSRRRSSSINRFLTENASLWMELDCGHFHRKYVCIHGYLACVCT